MLLFSITGYFYAQTARVQVIHNSADAAAEVVDVYLNDALLIDDFAFRTASPFIDAPAEQEFKIFIAPANSTSNNDAIYITPGLTLTTDETYVIVADGIVSASGYNPSQAFGLQIYAMGREVATNPTNTDVLVHHGSTDAPTVDVVETGVGAGLIVDNISYTEFQGYLELPTDDYVLEIRDETSTVTVAAFQAPLETLGLDGAALVVVASGFLNPSQNSDGADFGLWAALPTGGDLVMLPTSPFVGNARVQVVHNSADAAAEFVDVYLNETLLIDDFEFRTASPFINAPTGVELKISVAPAGSTGVEDAIYTTPTITLTANQTYVIVADGIVSGSGYNPPQPFGLQIYDMGREVATNSSNTDVLVHHGSTDAPTVDIVETGVGAGLIVDDISYTEFQGYLELPTDDYIIEVRDETSTVTVGTYQAPLATLGLDGAALVAVASGFLDPSQNSDGPAFGIFVALPSGGDLIMLPTVEVETARVQVIHNSADAAAEFVDVYLDDALLIPNFEFRTASPFIDAPAGVEFEISVAPAGSTGVEDAIYSVAVTLAADETYVVVADGIVSASGYNPPQPFGLQIYAMGREVATNSSNTDVLVHHGSTDAPTVDVVETGVGAGLIVDDISYTEFQGYLELPTDDYILEIRDETSTVTVAAFQAPLATLGLDGAALVVVASGFLDPSQNSDGAAFGLWAALPTGGVLVELPPISLGTEDFNESSFVMYPNPVVDQLFIQTATNDINDLNVTVTDMQGRIISQGKFTGNNNSLDVSNLSSGVYQVIINNGNKGLISKRFIKQ